VTAGEFPRSNVRVIPALERAQDEAIALANSGRVARADPWFTGPFAPLVPDEDLWSSE
jgi:hypothetical protein